ncbi:MAG: PadR family transcriptional regulator [Coprobacillus sp.]
MDESQLLKGILESCILKIISLEETYGYDIIVKLGDAGFHNVIEGTLYPILTRLEKKKYIKCRKAKSPLGPMRKYYTITDLGTESLHNYLTMYQEVIDKANSILYQDN